MRGVKGVEEVCAEPTLIAGQPAAPPEFPPANGASSQVLGRIGATEIRIFPGCRGLLDSTIAFGKLSFRGFAVRVAGDALEDRRSPSVLTSVRA